MPDKGTLRAGRSAVNDPKISALLLFQLFKTDISTFSPLLPIIRITYLLNMKDRLLGYIVIGIVTFFLFIPIGYLKWKASVPVTTRTIAFKGVTTLSFLAVQDPISLRGVEIGVVLGISIHNDTAYVKIETHNKIDLHEDYSITVIAKGVMGDRYLTIMPGDKQKPKVPPHTLLRGTVNIGPDDALSYITQLQSAIHTLVRISEELKNGTVQKQSLVKRIWQFTNDMDSLIRSTESFITEIDTSLKQSIDSILTILENTMALTRQITDEAPATTETLNNILSSIEKVLTQTDTLLVQTESVINKMEDPNNIIWKEYTGSIHKNLTKLQKILRQIECDPLILPVKL